MTRSTVLGIVLGLLLAGNAFGQQTIGACTVLPANNIWNTPIDTLQVLSNSSTMVNTIGASLGFHADFGAGTWNGGPIGIPFITVSGSQTRYPATFFYANESDQGPYAVPLNAPIEGGSNSTGDRHAIAVDTDNCVLYELYRAFPQSSSWTAGSGAIFDLNSNALRPATWTSADAAGLPIMPGLVTYEEVQSGEIRHAIRFTAPETRREYVWPARHYASSLTGSQYPRMGERFRLMAGFDISTYPSEVQVILRAMKKYGIILADNGSAWFISGKPDPRWNNSNLHTLGQLHGSNFEAVDATVLRISPDSGEAIQNGTSVTVSPPAALVRVGHSQLFTATVAGASGGVTWSVNDTQAGDATVGTIDSSGLYIAPPVVPSPGVVTVRARSVASPTSSGAASVTIEPSYEGDTAPRPFGDGSLSLADWVQTGRFAIGLDLAQAGSEFQRADCAPRDTRGNGVLSMADWVQAGRYGANLDPLTPTAGPSSPTAAGASLDDRLTAGNSSPNRAYNQTRSVTVVASLLARTHLASVVVWIDSAGIENAIAFSVSFDPSLWELVDAKADRDAIGATLILDNSQVETGRIGVALALPPGRSVVAGWRPLVDIRFHRTGRSAERVPRIQLTDDEPVQREVIDVWGNSVLFDWRSFRRR